LRRVDSIRKAWGKVRGAFGAVGGGFAWAGRGVRSNVAKAGRTVGGGVAKPFAAPRRRASSLIGSAREHPWLGIGIAAGVLVGVAWIAWAVYVSTENGMNAALGVLLTWPVLLGALALLAAPFVLTAMLVQRLRGSEPAIAGAPDVPETPTEPKTEEKPKEEESETEEDPAPKSA
jgi:hypothetical protein